MSVLCVDDEPRVLDGLKLTLRRSFTVLTATSGAEALALFGEHPGISVVISDMRMPVMDGAAFLTKVRQHWPDATRILLTGEPGRDAAIAAVNEGQVFRFLTKPCAPDKLLAAVDAAVRHHQLVTNEKSVLQETVLGSIRALVDILELVNPMAFGRGGRIKRLAVELASAAGLKPSWELEAAALLSQIGYVSLPSEVLDKLVKCSALSAAETALLADVPQVAQNLLARIPRLENVAIILAIVTRLKKPAAVANADFVASAAVLRAVLDFDMLIGKGESVPGAIATLQARVGESDIGLLAHLAALKGLVDDGPLLMELPLREVKVGMILLHDLRNDRGTLLVSRGYEVSDSFVQKMRNFGGALLSAKVRVRVERLPDPSVLTNSAELQRSLT